MNGWVKQRGGLAALPGQPQDRKAGYFRSAHFVDVDLGKLLSKVGSRVTVAEQSQSLIPTAAERCRTWLEMIEAA